MNILFICIGKLDIKNWSGTTYNIYKNLSKNNKLDVIELQTDEFVILKFISKAYRYLVKKVTNKKIILNRNKRILKDYKKQIEKKLANNSNYNCIFSIGSLPVTFLDTNLPIYMYTDGTVAAMKNYYEGFTNVLESNYNKVNNYEKIGLNKCKKIFAASKWVKDSMVNDYKIDSNKIVEVKIGANFESDTTIDDVKKFASNRLKNESINLLFIGVDKKRKGLQKFLNIFQIIKDKGRNVKACIIGCEYTTEDRNIINYKFLDKNNQEDLKLLKKFYEKANFFVLPTIAECVGVVFCEGASFGLPSISNATGGITSLVKNNETGKLFDINESADVIADYIVDLFDDKQKYYDMQLKTYEEYKKELNWNAIIEKMEKVMKNNLDISK